ncbi:transposase [Enterococcus italicus]
MRTVLQTLEKYINPIHNAFKYTLSNGPIEGVNNKVKNIKRSGYGYRNFYHLRSRVVISFTLTREAITEKPLYFKEDAAH